MHTDHLRGKRIYAKKKDIYEPHKAWMNVVGVVGNTVDNIDD